MDKWYRGSGAALLTLLAGCADAPPLRPQAEPLSDTGTETQAVASPAMVQEAPGTAADELVFTSLRDGHMQIYAMRGDGTEQRRVSVSDSPEMHPAIAANGALAFVSYRTGGGDIYRLDPGAETPVRLTETPGLEQLPRWSPDGRQLAYSAQQGGRPVVMVMNADGTGAKVVSGPFEQAAASVWSPDGTRLACIAVVDSVTRVVVADLVLGTHYLLTPGPRDPQPGKSGEYDPVWSPDGEEILFVHSGSREEGVTLRIAPAKGGDPVALTPPGNINSGASFSPDGSQILFLSNAGQSGGVMNLFVMNRDGSGRRALSGGAASHLAAVWARDGRHIYFVSFKDWPGQIYRADADGSGIVRLTNSAGQDSNIAVRPLPVPGTLAGT